MKTLIIAVFIVAAVYPWWGPELGIHIPFLNSFFEWAYASLSGNS